MALASMAVADECQFSPLKLKDSVKNKSSSVSAGGYFFSFLGADEENHVFEGPLRVFKEKKLICSFPDGIFENLVYYSAVKKYLVTKTYSGSCGEFRVYDLKTCQQVGSSAAYCGSARFNGVRVVNEPPCEPVGLGKRSCSMGKVYRVGQATCSFVFDEKASDENTKSKIGQTVAIDEKMEMDMPAPK